jgi:GH25 family lysozyme M1 (1,4-beta-N-acetylmuramidase)
MEQQRAWGIDVSRFQRGISFAAARTAGASFAFVRASTGAEVDLAFTDHVRRGRGELLLGAYHALQPGMPAGRQALALYVALGMADGFRLPLPPVVDVEKAGIDEGLVLGFLEEFAQLWDVRPVIYTSASKWHGLVGPGRAWAGEYPLWVAHWRATAPALPSPWTDWLFWQYDVAAVPFWPRKIDVNWFNGSVGELEARFPGADRQGKCGPPA